MFKPVKRHVTLGEGDGFVVSDVAVDSFSVDSDFVVLFAKNIFRSSSKNNSQSFKDYTSIWFLHVTISRRRHQSSS